MGTIKTIVFFLFAFCIHALVKAQEPAKRELQAYTKIVVAPASVSTDTSKIIYHPLVKKSELAAGYSKMEVNTGPYQVHDSLVNANQALVKPTLKPKDKK